MKAEKRLCPCCMEEHITKTISVVESNIFKGEHVDYDAEYFYCDKADEIYADEYQVVSNDIAMKNAYRKKMNLLTSDEIAAIRTKYGISQSDLCLLLGWGGKTITRYESHQVQDNAHDSILRKLDSDPEWFLNLLAAKKEVISPAAFEKYYDTGVRLFGQDHDQYLKSAIKSIYARYNQSPEACGRIELSLDVVAEMIRYFANSVKVTNLFLVKLWKMLWYADAFSYKRRGHAISGLVYRALPMGAVPLAYQSIIDLSTINYEVIEIGEGIGYKFLPTKDKEYHHLNEEDMHILDAVIMRFGKSSKNEIIEAMHKEDAYSKTAPNDIILFKYAKTLSLS